MIIKESALALNLSQLQSQSNLHKLITQPSSNWKKAIPELSAKDTTRNANNLQELLDVISPVKSPTKSTNVDGFHFEELLGQGVNKVKLARHNLSGEKVAIKIIEKSKLGKYSASVIRELLAMGSLNHSNVCSLLQVVDSSDTIFMIMEYLSGGELYSYIEEKGRLDENESRLYFAQICKGLDYIHKQQIIHRDLKPENIVFDENRNLKICDFGFADYYNSDGAFEEFCGSVEYSAPEMIARKKYIGPEVDIWSLGVVLYVMVTASMPFGETNVSRLFISIMQGKYEVPDFVSEDCKSLIKSILQPQVAQRATLEFILSHKWLFLEKSLDVPYSQSINTTIIQLLKEKNLDPIEISDFEKFQIPGNVKTAYFLFQKQFKPRTIHKIPKSSKPSVFSGNSPTKYTFQIKKPKNSKSLLANIRSKVLNREQTKDENKTPVWTTFTHQEEPKNLQMRLLRNILFLKGKITHFDDEEPLVLYGMIPVYSEQILDLEGLDEEIKMLMQDKIGLEMLFKAETEYLGEDNVYQTKFLLLNGHDKDWVVDQFDIKIMKLLQIE